MRSSPANRQARPAPAKGTVPAAIPVSIGLAWLGLLLAELRGAPLSHDALADGSASLPVALGIFGTVWVAMVVAMMLPSSYPVVRAFAATTAGVRNPRGRMAWFLIGYVSVWTLFGFALLAADFGIHDVVERSPGSGAAHAALTSGVLLVAGAFQLSGRKRTCLSRCRHPARLVDPGSAAAEARGATVALRLGLASGLDCLGACWALMLAVFALGSPQIVWMALFGGVMLYEKVGRRGVAVARLAGVALLAASVLVALS
jgi:predicted metal-binding membrane protein